MFDDAGDAALDHLDELFSGEEAPSAPEVPQEPEAPQEAPAQERQESEEAPQEPEQAEQPTEPAHQPETTSEQGEVYEWNGHKFDRASMNYLVQAGIQAIREAQMRQYQQGQGPKPEAQGAEKKAEEDYPEEIRNHPLVRDVQSMKERLAVLDELKQRMDYEQQARAQQEQQARGQQVMDQVREAISKIDSLEGVKLSGRTEPLPLRLALATMYFDKGSSVEDAAGGLRDFIQAIRSDERARVLKQKVKSGNSVPPRGGAPARSPERKFGPRDILGNSEEFFDSMAAAMESR